MVTTFKSHRVPADITGDAGAPGAQGGGVGAAPWTVQSALVAAAVVVAVTVSSLSATPIGRAVAARSGNGSAPEVRLLSDTTPAEQDTKTNCVYPSNSEAMLSAFDAATGTDINCVLLFNMDKPDWSSWTTAWWETPPSPDMDWLRWKTAVPGRQIVITQSMVPESAPSDWRVLGAEGAYDHYATQLAENLVSAGLGDSIIRLGAEANAD